MIRKTASRKKRVRGIFAERLLFVAFGLLMVGARCDAASSSRAGLPPEILSFITNKEAQARALAKQLDLKVAGEAWAYPHLSPHGWIFQLHREPLARLSEEVVAQDRQFWVRQQAEWIGGWLTTDTPVQEVRAFVRKTFGRRDWTGFQGDRQFIEQDYANRLNSKLRSSIGGLYNWRLTTSTAAEERRRMMAEADFAFRQAFAFCPQSPEAVFHYVSLLVSADRTEDALRVAGTAQSLEPDNNQLATLVSDLTRLKRTKPQ